MSDLVEAAPLDQLPPGKGVAVTIAGKALAIFNVDGKIFAIDGNCPHAGGSLGMGKLDGGIVTCPVHGMKIDVTNGCFAGSSGNAVAAYPVQVFEGKILVAI
jgi:3-phenylpropionate/trans-cinnamate dioxygenase ferredoxin subunit